MSQPDHPARIGDYEILGVIGQGGMGVVYAARQPNTQREVAVKVITSDSPVARERFEREGELLARIQHPNVVTVHALGEVPAGPYLVTDRVEGESLRAVHERSPLAPERAAAIVRDLADAVAALHAVGVVHRDLKPENVILRGDGVPVLIDFGLAFAVELERLTQTGAWVGTPWFIAPEQMDGATFDERVDIYGLGAIFYALLAGRPPFAAEDSWLTLMAAVAKRPPDWDAVGDLPRPLRAVLERCLAKTPEQRYPTATLLRDDLDRALRGESVPRLRPRRALAGLAALVALALLVLALVQGERQPARESAAESDPTEIAPPPRARPAPRATRSAPLTPAGWRLWRTLTLPKVYEASRGYCVFLGGQRALLASSDATPRIWEPDTESLTDLRPRSVTVWGVAAGQDAAGRWLSVIAYSTELVVVGPGRAERSIPLPTPPRAVALTPNAKDALVGTETGALLRFDLATGRLIARVVHATSNFVGAVTADAKRVVTASGERRGEGLELGVRVWTLASLRPEGKPLAIFGPARTAAIHPSGSPLAVGTSAGRVFLFSLDPPHSKVVLASKDALPQDWVRSPFVAGGNVPVAHAYNVRRVLFSPDGTLLYSIAGTGDSQHTKLKVWDVARGEQIESVTLTRSATTLDVSPDGRRLVVGYPEGLFEVWIPAD